MKKQRLLIVDDNKIFGEGLKIYYKNIFNEIYIAENKKAALKMLKKIKFNSAIIDLMLDMNNQSKYEGTDIVKVIKRDKKGVKIVVVTAVEDEQIINSIKTEKNVKLLKKPVNIAELTDAII